MIFRNRKTLGLALRDRSILIAEVHFNGEPNVTRMEEFTFPAELSLQQPQPLGKALKQFLKQKQFTAGRAVAGVPARWLMSREREVPPASAAMAANMLRLQAERIFPTELKAMVFDFAGRTDPKSPTKVLVLAMLKEQLNQIMELAEAAGLKLEAVTSSALALASSGSVAGDGKMVLSLGTGAAELAMCGAGKPLVVRHMSMAGSGGGFDNTAAISLGNEIRRTISALPDFSSSQAKLVVWDSAGFDPAVVSMLGQQAGLPVELAGDLSKLSVRSSMPSLESFRYALPVALAVGEDAKSLPVNFLHSRLTPPRVRRLGRRTGWAMALAATAAVGLGSLLLDINNRQNDLDDLNDRMKTLEPGVKAAEALADKIKAARGWYEGRSVYLTCLKELTQAFPDDGQIWATSLTVKDNGKGVLNGRAAGQPNVLALLDGISKNNRFFTEVKMGDITNRISQDATFNLNFTFKVME